MKLFQDYDIHKLTDFFEVMATGDHSQLASMVLAPGAESGEYGSEHPGSDQVLFVVEGEGTAYIEGKDYPLSSGDLVLIQAGEQHQIRADDESTLRTINFYSPPAY